jgi:multiple sugar transport system ATP-binding protein
LWPVRRDGAFEEWIVAELVLSGLGKTYADGTRALRGLDLEVRDGEFVVLVGPSGCGKTTTLRIIAGLESATAGTIRIGERVVNEIPSRDRDIAMVFQSYALYPHLNVYENIAFGLRLRNLSRADVDRRVREMATILDLRDHLWRKPRNLSGGERQRVAMGRAIVRQPRAFLMDEPLSNLDANRRAWVRAEIARLQKRLSTTTLYVTHDQTEAMTLGDRVVVMRDGVLLQVGPPQDVYDRPDNLFVAAFFGSPGMNCVLGHLEATACERLSVRLGEASVDVPDGVLHRRPALRRYVGRALVVGIRPEDMEDATIVGDPVGPALHSVADLVEVMGSDVLVHFPVDAPVMPAGHISNAHHETESWTNGVLVGRLSPRSHVFEGQRITVWLDVARLHYFDPATGSPIWHK